MNRVRSTRIVQAGFRLRVWLWLLLACGLLPAAAPADAERALLPMLDAPLLFTKRHSYTGIHIYDTFYKWPPGGGGIYVLENPRAPRTEWRIRAVIDPTTPGTLGLGVYTHPDLHWDAEKLLFCFKGEPEGSTSIYEIRIDGTGLRRLTDPGPSCADYKGRLGGQHDVAPAYLPDGRIVFLSTRPSGLVPCNNTGVAILHVMDADGSNMHTISVNNVNEFDPSVLPDGRILFGRWEYVDKNALTIQSLWTVNPDGTGETAFFANNMVFPEAILDARGVPGSRLVVGTFAKHNASPRGSIAFIDQGLAKNGTLAIANLEHPENPTHDTGESCEPWPLSEDVVLFSGRPQGFQRNVLELIDRSGRRVVVLSDPEICLHSPMLVKPRPRPPAIVRATQPREKTGNFYLLDIHQGLTGVKRGEVKWLRVIEETSRVSATHAGSNPYNQTFLVSCALAFSVKNFLGIVPVDENGSAYFEVPSGRAVYFQALDGEGRLVHSMRSFVQAAPGTTRSCIGCHEDKHTTPPKGLVSRELLRRGPNRLQPESWGSGFLDYPSMVQPVLDRRCVSCHGGEKGIAAGMDLSGGWTEHFNISYENLTNRRETQLVAYWIAGIDCMNGTAFWSVPRFPPRAHGSGAAPLAEILTSGHDGRIPDLIRSERDLLMAWIDSNGLYHGSWDFTEHGCALPAWNETRSALAARMLAAGCGRCHGDGASIAVFESDWINLERPEFSRILRAPLRAGGEGYGLELCRDRKVDAGRRRIQLLRNGYAHAVQPLAAFAPQPVPPPDRSGEPVATFGSTSDPHYEAMLGIIRKGREKALAAPRVDMPGAEIIAGACRQSIAPPVPEVAPALSASADPDGVVHVVWERSARTIGLEAELHRSSEGGFGPADATLVARTTLSAFTDRSAPAGRQHYALVLAGPDGRSRPAYAAIDVPPPSAPPAPTALIAVSASGTVRLEWKAPSVSGVGFHVHRGRPASRDLDRITAEPVRAMSYIDAGAEMNVPYAYEVRAVSRRGIASEPTGRVEAAAILIEEPMFAASFGQEVRGLLYEGGALPGTLHGDARSDGGALDLARDGSASFRHHAYFDLSQPLTVECWVRLDEMGSMPVIVSCGSWNQAGWFIQQLSGKWRWHAGGIDCDGGRAETGRWIHLAASFGRTLRLFQDGVQVAEASGTINAAPWPGDLLVGQYSAAPSAAYQVRGRIAGLRIYHRSIDAAEAAKAAGKRPE